MTNLTQTEMGIPEDYVKPMSFEKEKRLLKQINTMAAKKHGLIHPNLPYYESIVHFHQSSQVYVPNDILFCFLEGVRVINSCASRYANAV